MEKRIDIFFKGHNQVSPAARAAASETEEFGRKVEAQQRRRIDQFKALDAAQRQSNQQQASRRSQIQDTLGKSQVENLRREVALGRQGAKIDLERLQITQKYEAERKQLQRITRDELATSKQKIAAERQLVALQTQHNRQLDRMTARRLFGDPAGGIATKNRQLAQQNTLATRAAGSVTRLVGAYLGFSAVSMAVRSTTRAIMEHVDGVVRLQGELKDLIALGNNAGNQGAIREQVLSLSSSTGRSTQDIADLLFNVQSGSGGLDQSVQDQILNSTLLAGEATSAKLNDVATSLIKSYNAYGEEVKGVADLQNRLFFSAERGIITYGELSKLLPRVLPAAEAFNFSFNETLAALSLGTRIGGKNEETFTAIRNVFLRMNNATKEGIELTGSLADRMEQLSQVDPETLKKIFGDEAVTLVLSLTKNVEALRKEVGLFDQIPDDLLEKKLRVNLEDKVASRVSTINSSRQSIQNSLANSENLEGAAGDFSTRRTLAEANLRREMGVFGSIGFGDFDLANIMASAEAVGFSSTDNANILEELQHQFESAMRINNFEVAADRARQMAQYSGGRGQSEEAQLHIQATSRSASMEQRIASLGVLADPDALLQRFGDFANEQTLRSLSQRFSVVQSAVESGYLVGGSDLFSQDFRAIEKEFAPILAGQRDREAQQNAEAEREAAAQARRDRLAPLLRDQQFKLDIATQQAAGNTLGAAMLRIEQQYAEALAKNANDPELIRLIEKRKKLEQQEATYADQQRLRDQRLELQSLQNQVKVQRLASGGKNAEAEIERLRFSFFEQRVASPLEHTGALRQLEASAVAEVREREARRLEDLEIQVKRQQLLAAGDRLGAELLMIEKEFARRIEDAAGPGEQDLLEQLKNLQIQSAQRGQDVLSNGTPGALGVDPFFSGAAERFRINGNDPQSLTAANTKEMLKRMEKDAQERNQRWQKLDRDNLGRYDTANDEKFIDLA